MSGYELKRRRFIQVMMSLPLGYAVGCAGPRGTPDRESLSKLVLVLGPWPAENWVEAEEFAGRFLAADNIVGLYLPESSAVIRSLASRFPERAMSVKELDLAALSSGERDLVLQLAQQIYSLVELRFLVSNEPRWGTCLGERTRYMQDPASLGRS